MTTLAAEVSARFAAVVTATVTEARISDRAMALRPEGRKAA